MVKKILVVMVCFISLVTLVTILNGQTSKKTITLPNGEVVWDLNGEWDTLVENKGPNAGYGNYPQMDKITQTGSSFVAIRMIVDPYNKIGSQHFRGELDKSGIKEVTIIAGYGLVEAKGQISDDGNKIIIDDGEKVRLTLTRK